MLKWLEHYHKRNDEKFMRIIQDSDNAEKYLSDLYRHRITLSIAFLAFSLVWILLRAILSPSDSSGTFLGILVIMLINYMAIDSQIKMIQMINFMKSTVKFEKETLTKQSNKA